MTTYVIVPFILTIICFIGVWPFARLGKIAPALVLLGLGMVFLIIAGILLVPILKA